MSRADICTTPIRSRRAVLTTMVVALALPIAATLPVAAPAVAAPLSSDAELLELVERFIAADAEWDRLNRIWDEMDEMPEFPRKPPAVLKIREGDSGLGIPQSQQPEYPGYYSGSEVGIMRMKKWRDRERSSFLEDDEKFVATICHITPSSEARARADEIVAAFDKSPNRKSRAYRAAERAKDRAMDISHDFANQIAEMQAMTVQGLAAKARCVKSLWMDSDVARSIVDDVLAMAERPNA
jgi:hypothetical protein